MMIDGFGYSWFSAMETLAKLHRIDYKAIGLGDYGRPSDFYNRQMRSLSKVSAAQSAAKDQDTGEVVGPIPRMEEMFAWFKKNQPADESTIVHGDFKVCIHASFFACLPYANRGFFIYRLTTW